MKRLKMATREMRFFAIPQEFIDMLNEIILSLNLNAIFAIRMTGSKTKILGIPLDLNTLKELDAFDIFLTDKKIEDGILVDDINRAKEGWVQVVLPKEHQGKLFKGDIAIRTDWYDEQTKNIYDNKENLKLFDKIARRLKKHFKYPLIGYDIRSGASCIYQIGYTEAVKRFLKEGGELSGGLNENDLTTVGYAVDESDIRINTSYQPKRKQKA